MTPQSSHDRAAQATELIGSGGLRWVPTSMCLREASETLAADEIGLLLVHGPTGLAGVVSERDIVMALAEGADLESERVQDVMSDHVVTVPPDADLATVMSTMARANVRHVVVTHGDEVVGLVSARDVLRAWEAVAPVAQGT